MFPGSTDCLLLVVEQAIAPSVTYFILISKWGFNNYCSIIDISEMNAKCLANLRCSINDNFSSPRSQLVDGRLKLEESRTSVQVQCLLFPDLVLISKGVPPP